MAFDISLTAGMRADLTSLQGTAQLLNRTQQRLSSGKAVNSAVDDPSAYFAAQDHLNHASDLSSRKSDMGEAIQAVQAANTGITNITTLINQAQGLVQSAQSANQTTRATLAAQFNTLRTQIDQLASDSGYNGKNFLQNDTLNVLFNETGNSSLTVKGFYGNSSGLGITTAAAGTGSVAITYTGVSMGKNVASGTVVQLAHSGTIKAGSGVVVTQSITGVTGSSWINTNRSASNVSGKSVALGHIGIATNVVVYQKLNTTATVAATGSVAGKSATLANSGVLSVSISKHTVTNANTATLVTHASAGSVSGKSYSLGHIGLVSNLTVYAKTYVNVATFLATGAAATGASATLAHVPLGSITVKGINGTALTQGTNYTAYLLSGVEHVAMLTTATGGVTLHYDYAKSLTKNTDYTVSTGGLGTAAQVTFIGNQAAASAIGVSATYTSKTAIALVSGTDYRTYTTGGATHIVMKTTATAGINVTYSYDKNLSAGTDYTVSTGTLTTKAKVTFTHAFTGASAIGVTYNVQASVASGNYKVTSGTGASAGTITFGGGGTVTGIVKATYTATANGLWASNDALQTDTTNLNNAITTLRTQASTMAANLSVITTRQTWSEAMIVNLQTGSDNLTLADMNEEGANMLALQTRQQLGVQALSLASQANQSVMRLFG